MARHSALFCLTAIGASTLDFGCTAECPHGTVKTNDAYCTTQRSDGVMDERILPEPGITGAIAGNTALAGRDALGVPSTGSQARLAATQPASQVDMAC
jgi:hypothetical protein